VDSWWRDLARVRRRWYARHWIFTWPDWAMTEYTLIITDADGASVTHSFSDQTIAVGRKAGDIVLPDPSVSSQHAEFTYRDGELSLTDLNSSNGTYVDGKRIEGTVLLQEGSLVRFGHCLVKVDDIEGEEADKTSMLTAEQMAEVRAKMAGMSAPAAQPVAAPVPTPAPRQPEPVYRPEPERREPVYEPEPAYEAAPAAAPAPVRGYPPAGPSDGYADDDGWDDGGVPDWAPVDSGQELQPKPASPAAASAPAVRRSTGPKVDPPPKGDETFGSAMDVIKPAVMDSIDLVKNWKQGPAVGWDEIKAALKGGWDLLEPFKKTAPLPLLALSGISVLFGILVLLVNALAIVGGLVGLAALCVYPFAVGGVLIHLIRGQVGAPLDIKSSVMATLADPKTYILSLLIAGLISIAGIAGVILPGILALGYFILPVYLIEGRRGVDLNRRSSDLFFKDSKRVLLTVLVFFVISQIGGGIIGGILGVIPAVGPYLNVLFLGVWSPVMTTYGLALGLWFYFDIRREMETGDAAQEALQNVS
jgi:pSer/pThr/pTyr-binding forkhead associated (FHA) protein